MRSRVIVFATLAVVMMLGVMLGACGGSSSKTPSKSTNPPGATSVTYLKAGLNPSNSSKMVCSTEAQKDMFAALGTKATRVTTPTWRDHVYSCTYVYPNGSFTLNVKEMSSTKETADYFNGYKASLGSAQSLFGLGQGAFIAKNNDVVVRKDYKVLFIDVAKAPAGEGVFIPAMTRQDVATNIAAVIMGCWQDT